MRKKAMTFVFLLMILDVTLIVIRLSNPSHAFQEETSDKSRIKQIKTADEVSANDEEIEQNYYLDLVSLEPNQETLEIANDNYSMPEDLKTDLINIFKDYKEGSSFLVVSLTDGMAFGYNIDQSYSSASTIKAAYALYLYKLLADEKANFNDEIAYEAKFYNKGTGVIKDSPYGTVYTVKDLIYNMIHESDNSAYLMLLNKYKWDGFNEMLDDLGTPEIHLSNTSRWGKLSCRSSAIIWQEIYRFSKTDQEGKELFDLLLNAKYNYFKEVLSETASASKTGFTPTVVHETGIVMDDDNPYIVVILSNTGGNSNNAHAHVINGISKIVPIMQQYKEYKNNQEK